MKIDFRLAILLMLLAASTYFIVSPYLLKRQGVMVSSLAEGSKCSMRVGDVITSVGGYQVANKGDFIETIEHVKKGEYINMVVNGGPGGCTAIDDSQLGVEVVDIPSSQLMFGLDIQGGVTALLKPETNIEKTAEILRKRAEVYNIPEFRLSVEGSTIKITALSEDAVLPLLQRGRVEARVLEEVEVEAGSGYLPLGDNVYTVEPVNKSVRIGNILYQVNDSFRLEDVDLSVRNVTNASVFVEAKIFDNKDVLKVLSSGTLSYDNQRRVYQFSIPVEISQEATNKFSKVLKNAPAFSISGQLLVRGFLVYYLDEKPISRLNIPLEFAKQEIKQISILGISPDVNEATTDKLKVLAAVESGELPTSVNVVKVESYKPTTRGSSLMLVITFVLIYAIVSCTVLHLRYRKLKVGLTAVSLDLAVCCTVLGMIALVQRSFGTWVVNLQTIAGFIVFLAISLAQLILTAERLARRKEFMVSKLKASNFIDFSVTAASFILIFTPFKFFGLTLLSALIIELFLARPVYSKML